MRCNPRRHIPTLLALSLLLPLAPDAASAGPPGRAAHPAKLWIAAKPGKRAQRPTLESFAKLSEQLSPAVVNVIVTMRNTHRFDGLFERPITRESKGYGSGFIIHPDGYTLTNNHVIEGASVIKLRLKDKREFRAYVVGRDPLTDVALLKIEGGKNFPTVALGDSDRLRVGEPVLAIGNPLGLNHTVTSGIISALKRKDVAPAGKALLADFIQTDASINPGNSGGPLISLRGEVIGINTAINRQGQGIGFAVPINVIKALLPQLKSSGHVVRSWLGVRVQELTPLLAKSFGDAKMRGALVAEVVENSPAADGGVRPGDIILTFNGKPLRSSDQLPLLISTGGPNRDIPVAIWRKGKRRNLKVTLRAIPNQKKPRLGPGASSKKEKRDPSLGIRLEPPAPNAATTGVTIKTVSTSSPASSAGLTGGDIVEQVGDSAVRDERAFFTALRTFKPRDVIRLKISRKGRVMFLAFER